MSPVASAIAQVFEAIANGTLGLDPASQVRLDRLDGKSIMIEVEPPGERILASFQLGSVRVSGADHDALTSVHVRGSATDLASAFLGAESSGRLHIDGDEVVLGEVRELFGRFKPDFETPLRSIVGDTSAEVIANAIDTGAAALRAIFDGIGGETRRMTVESAAAVYLDTSDLDAFSKRLHELQLKVDRVSRRAELLAPEDAS